MKQRKKKMMQRRKRFFFLLAVCMILIWSILAVSASGDGRKGQIEYVVQPGDSLWKIALQHCPKGTDLREWIYEVCKANGSDALIYPGQVLQIRSGAPQ